MTSFIAACGSGRSTSFIPAVPAAWSVTTIAFMMIFSSVICLFGENVAGLESPFDILCQGPCVASEGEGGTAALPAVDVASLARPAPARASRRFAACSLVSLLEHRPLWSRSGQGLVLGIDD